ncbi:MAG: acyl-ACP--UDP-N-acetylglucosamine O-acyltransferase [Flavobacteriales bacterium]|nr:acyl-ACP--UDP-N-acetylglucosamine O-acyltransferase [Flavobacteriales bacterium]
MIQPLAYIHPGAKIARNVVIEPFTTISNNVEIGSGTWIGPNVTIMEGARIGKNCKIFSGAVISGIPQDLKFEGEETTCYIGDNTTIRECVTISRGTKAAGTTRVGKNCLIMAYAHVAHDCILGDNVILANSVGMSGHCEVGNFVVIGGLTGIHQFVKLGSHAMIAGGSLVRKDVPPFVIAGKEPVSYMGINSVGLRRRGFSPETINEIQNIYRFLFQKNLNITQALNYIEVQVSASKERDEIIEFIRSSSRGLMRGFQMKE